MGNSQSAQVQLSGGDHGEFNLAKVVPLQSIDCSFYNPTDQNMSVYIVIEKFEQHTLLFAPVANVQNDPPTFKSKTDKRVYENEEKKGMLCQVPLQLNKISNHHGNAKSAKVAGHIICSTFLASIGNDTYGVVLVELGPHSGVDDLQFSVNLNATKQNAHAFRMACYQSEVNSFRLIKDFYFGLVIHGTREQARQTARTRHFPQLWAKIEQNHSLEQLQDPKKKNQLLSDCFRKKIPHDYVHPLFSSEMTNCIIVQRDSLLTQVTLQELYEKGLNQLANQQNHKVEILELHATVEQVDMSSNDDVFIAGLLNDTGDQNQDEFW